MADIHRLMRDYLHEASLVSAYDLSWRFLLSPDVYATEVLFLDSGGYEARALPDPTEPYLDERPGLQWTLDDYRHILDETEALSRLVMVSFDLAGPAPLPEQLRLARALFEQYPRLAGDFLCKPASPDAPFVDVDVMVDAIAELASFDVIGVTEKELGETVLARCASLLRIRAALHCHGSETAVHVFGCLDPATVLAYFLCGADSFDGLAWLRLAFSNGIPIYHPTSILLDGAWATRDQDALAVQRVENLRWLREQEKEMARYCRRHKPEDLVTARGLAELVLPLVRDAGLEL